MTEVSELYFSLFRYNVRLVTYDSRFHTPLNDRLPVPGELKRKINMYLTKKENVINLVIVKTWCARDISLWP